MRFKLANRLYVPVYVICSFGVLLLLAAWLLTGHPIMFYLVSGAVLMVFALQIKACPYSRALDNVSICFNSLTLTLFLALFYLRNNGFIGSSSQTDTMLCFGIAALLCACTLLSLIRLLREIWCSQEGQSRKAIPSV